MWWRLQSITRITNYKSNHPLLPAPRFSLRRSARASFSLISAVTKSCGLRRRLFPVAYAIAGAMNA
jgi:hypothetical protein